MFRPTKEGYIMNDKQVIRDREFKEHFKKVDQLVNYYMDNMEYEKGTIQEALENLFAELGTSDMDRAMAELASKKKKRYY